MWNRPIRYFFHENNVSIQVHYINMLNHIETIREKRNRYEKCEYKLEQKLLNNIQSII